MHTDQTQHRFIELRAQGHSLARIADQLSVSKRTLVDWNRKCQSEISTLRAVELEALHEKIFVSDETELLRLADQQKAIEQELASRDLKSLSTDQLYRLASLVRRQIHEMRNLSHSRVTRMTDQPIDPDIHNTVGPLPPADYSQNGTSRGLPADSSRHHATPEAVGGGSFAPVETTVEAPAVSNRAEPETKGDDETPIRTTGLPNLSSETRTINDENPNLEPKDSESEPYSSAGPVEEHCLHCAASLPPLLPDGSRPSPWCDNCHHPICGPAGFSLREHCPSCSRVLPVHGYNVKRFSNTCPECQTRLPNLDSDARIPWLPPGHPMQTVSTL